jgi:hypothetical protein
LVTRDHDMYVQHGDADYMNCIGGAASKRDAFAKVRASRLVDSADVVARHLAYAANGVGSSGNSASCAASLVCASVGVDAELASRVLQLYGFWLGVGAVADERMLRFRRVERFNVPWLMQTLDLLALTERTVRAGAVVVAASSAWLALFDSDAIAPWVWSLDRAALCDIVDGLRRASPPALASEQPAARGDGGARRDELVRVLLMAGFSAHFDARQERLACVVCALRRQCATVARLAGVPSSHRCARAAKSCRAAYTGRVWCFAMPSGFVWARRVLKDGAGVVTRASRALIVGNCGSPLYMAPEVLRGDAYEQSADLFSVGAIVFEMLTGSPPFKARTPMELQRLHDTATVTFPANVPLSQPCVALLSALLRKDVAQRLSHGDFFAHPWLRATSADIMYNALVDACRGGIAIAGASARRAGGRLAAERCRRRRRRPASAVVSSGAVARTRRQWARRFSRTSWARRRARLSAWVARCSRRAGTRRRQSTPPSTSFSRRRCTSARRSRWCATSSAAASARSPSPSRPAS